MPDLSMPQNVSFEYKTTFVWWNTLKKCIVLLVDASRQAERQILVNYLKLKLECRSENIGGSSQKSTVKIGITYFHWMALKELTLNQKSFQIHARTSFTKCHEKNSLQRWIIFVCFLQVGSSMEVLTTTVGTNVVISGVRVQFFLPYCQIFVKKKKSHVYESVDDKCLSLAIRLYLNIWRKKVSASNGII